jgi:transcriptional regulator PpsR
MNNIAGAVQHDAQCPPGCTDTHVTSKVITAASDLALFVLPDGTIEDIAVGDAVVAHPWAALVGKRWEETTTSDSKSKVDLLLSEARAGAVTRPREINLQVEGAPEALYRFSAVLLNDDRRVLALGRDLRPVAVLQQQLVGSQQAVDREFERMRQAETRYRLLFQITSEAVLVADATTHRVTESNPAAASLYDESSQAMQGRAVEELVDSTSWPAAQSYLAAVEAGGHPSLLSIQLPRSRRAALLSASTFRQSGSLLLLIRLRPIGEGTALDVSKTARAARVQTVVDGLPDGFVVIGEDRRILLANEAFCDMVQQTSEAQVLGQPLDRWLGRQGVDLNILLANLREHGSVRNFATIIVGEYNSTQEAIVSAVAAPHAKVPALGFVIRTVSARLGTVPDLEQPSPRSVGQMLDLVGRVSLKEIVRESTDLIERLCIEAALKVSGDNRASAAQLLGLSRQGLYSKLRRHGLGDLDPRELG